MKGYERDLAFMAFAAIAIAAIYLAYNVLGTPVWLQGGHDISMHFTYNASGTFVQLTAVANGLPIATPYPVPACPIDFKIYPTCRQMPLSGGIQ